MRPASRFRAAVTASTLAIAAGVACAPVEHAARNLVLITVDTTRADHLGCYGAGDVQTPNIDRIAAAGSLFERAFAVAPITAPSHTAILSGTFPPFNQVRDNDVFAVPADLPWLPAILQQHGYRTAGFVAAYPLRAGIGFSRGFDSFSDSLKAPAGSLVVTNLQTVGVPSRKGERISEEFELWLAAHRDRGPFFAWLHYYDPHWPWQPGAGYAELYASRLYDGEIAYMDDCIGGVLRSLAEHGLAADTGIVLVGDHGEGLGDHGEQTHALLAYNSTLRVPLIVHLPWLKAQRHRIDSPVSNADVMPTVLEALGIDPAPLLPPLHGRSLLASLAPGSSETTPGGGAERQLYFETFYPYHHYRWSPLSGFIMGDHKFIHGPFDESFDLAADMAELSPIGTPAELSADAARLSELKLALRSGRPDPGRHDPNREELAQLRALGYVGGGVGVDAEALEDLSSLTYSGDKFDVFHKYNEIGGLVIQHRMEEALDLAQSIATADPRQKEARLMVATFNARLDRVVSADRAFTELVRDFPDKDVVFQAGTYFLNRRLFEQARECFERLVADDPGDVEAVTRLAQVAVAQARPDEARARFQQALEIDPSFREALVGLAVLRDRQGSPEARELFETAATSYPFDPQVNLDYGVYLLRHGREDDALERLRRAADLADGDLLSVAHMTLAAFYEHRGDLPRAQSHLREVLLATDNPAILQEAQRRLAELDGR